MAARRTASRGWRFPGLFDTLGGSGNEPLLVEVAVLAPLRDDFPDLYAVPFLAGLFRPFDRWERDTAAFMVRVQPDSTVSCAMSWGQVDAQAQHVAAGRHVGFINASGDFMPVETKETE